MTGRLGLVTADRAAVALAYPNKQYHLLETALLHCPIPAPASSCPDQRRETGTERENLVISRTTTLQEGGSRSSVRAGEPVLGLPGAGRSGVSLKAYFEQANGRVRGHLSFDIEDALRPSCSNCANSNRQKASSARLSAEKSLTKVR